MVEAKVVLLMDTLNREREAIFSGKFDVMGRVSREKSKLLDTIDFSALSDRTNLSVIHHLDRNQRVMAAVILGVKSAIRQLEETPNGKGMASIYTAWGLKSAMNEPESTNSKKY